jgi:hypothetical protein
MFTPRGSTSRAGLNVIAAAAILIIALPPFYDSSAYRIELPLTIAAPRQPWRFYRLRMLRLVSKIKGECSLLRAGEWLAGDHF